VLTIRTRAEAEELAAIRQALGAYCASLELSEQLASAVVIAANEACTMAIRQAADDVEHGLELRVWIGPPGFLHAGGSATVEAGGTAGRALYISIGDGRQAMPGSWRPDALGVRFMRNLADDVHVIDHGRFGIEVILEFRLGTGP
jgi:anti-sigma regulatory factor (Ser/Thr protein kinase)